MMFRGVAVGVIMELQVVFARPSRSQPIKIQLLSEDLVEAFRDSGDPIKYSEQKALLELTAVTELRTPR
jgi:hypothetical protein